jgi:hypothetical protein
LEKIQGEHITPTSKWQFRLRSGALWIPGIFITILGACAFAGMLFGALHAGWKYREFIEPSPFIFFLKAIPLIWIASFVIFAGAIIKMTRITKTGYRYTSGMILGGSLIASLVLGALLFLADSNLGPNPVIRFPVEKRETQIWSNPAQGRIAGIVHIRPDGIILLDIEDKMWMLDVSEIQNQDLLVDSSMIRVLGTMLDEDSFQACMIMPWEFAMNHHLPPPTVENMSPPHISTTCMNVLQSLRSFPHERNMVVHP